MKKKLKRITYFFLCICFVFLFNSCKDIENKMQYLGDSITLKLDDSATCQPCSLKCWVNDNSATIYTITPSGFDLDALETRNYKMNITVKYDVYYVKDYNVPFDIGYAGAPKYEVFITNSNGLRESNINMSTSTKSVSRSITYTSSITDIKNNTIKLTFSTDNIQNIIYFKNIKISYHCYI